MLREGVNQVERQYTSGVRFKLSGGALHVERGGAGLHTCHNLQHVDSTCNNIVCTVLADMNKFRCG